MDRSRTRGFLGSTALAAATVAIALVLLLSTAVTHAKPLGATGGTPVEKLSTAIGKPPSPVVIHSVIANLSTVDVNMAFNVTVNASGGSNNPANYLYTWTGLPPGCVDSAMAVQNCTPTSAGSYTVKVTVNDSVTHSNASGTVGITVNADPSVSSFKVSPNSSTQGTQITFTVTASGGTGTLSYTYFGLPLGCSGANATVVCTPTRVGLYNVSVTVADSLGYTSAKSYATVDVTTATSSGIGTTGWAIVGGIVAVGAIVTIALLLQARREERAGSTTPESPVQTPPPGAGGPPPTGGGSPPSM